ncbi:MAG: 30S ribosomal protein S14 type Z [Mycoplasmataceae bacterium]|nr:MAG: 30S ribosomal protein S14 type Z [Mycoplasmataceae bacterium]
MTRKALLVKAQKTPKYLTRKYNRCRVCGRSRSVFKDTLLCRIDFRKQIYEGLLPGWSKGSW